MTNLQTGTFIKAVNTLLDNQRLLADILSDIANEMELARGKDAADIYFSAFVDVIA